MNSVRRTLPFLATVLLASSSGSAPQPDCGRRFEDLAKIVTAYEGQATAMGASFLHAAPVVSGPQGVAEAQAWSARARTWSAGLKAYRACLEGQGCSLGAVIREQEARDAGLGAWMKSIADDGLAAATARAGKAVQLLDDAALRLSESLAAASSCAAPLAPSAPALDIDHKAVACVVANRFPRLEARLLPADNVAVARVVFQGASPEWYSVAMKSGAGGYSGVLPKPLKSLKAFRYYIEVTDRALVTSRTPDYTANVVEGVGECPNRIVAAALATASVILQGPAGLVALPAGFAPVGVIAGGAAGASTAGVATAGSGASAGAAGAAGGAAGSGAAGAAAGGAAVAGGGVSAGAIVGIVAGVGGAAAVGAAASGGGDTAPTPTPMPTPTPCPACYAGQWSMQITFTAIGPLCENEKDFRVGQPQTVAPMTFAPDGRISFPSNLDICTGCTFTVNAAGNMRLEIPADLPGQGRCPSGSGSGQCTSTRACSGNATQGGDQIAFVISR